MTDTTDIPEDDLSDLLAAEYVLGTLPLAERDAAATRLRRDAGFAVAVAQWEARLAGLNDGFDEAPAPDLLPRIEARLFGTPAHSPRFWQGWKGLLGGAIAAATLGVAVLVMLPQSQAPLLPVTTLAAEGSNLRYSVGLKDGELHLTRISGDPAPQGRVHELWLIAGQSAPVSLGLITGTEKTLSAANMQAGMVLAITDEPEGGAPGGVPTGQIVASGTIEQI
ncbi:anti-sigma factor [Pseudorhodobacter sp.]|uniref:anti-sigma factor n=1 Tax=Pseudorhodobacter sp. TaxID=1934400 RepID=UPI00264A2BFB|nr:anti-sigma factor [Pseudorhodobacter sp.]MDN5786873.1 anti-sigma factor [Pseudorhodobacter sp.]